MEKKTGPTHRKEKSGSAFGVAFTFPFSDDAMSPTDAGALESRPIWRTLAYLRFTP